MVACALSDKPKEDLFVYIDRGDDDNQLEAVEYVEELHLGNLVMFHKILGLQCIYINHQHHWWKKQTAGCTKPTQPTNPPEITRTRSNPPGSGSIMGHNIKTHRMVGRLWLFDKSYYIQSVRVIVICIQEVLAVAIGKHV
ncbi:hypothetical protein C5167_024355 [Papaver somniferum]|uniref:Uncharacterized protein n=1 Tax=Papaver somniferum TaxID=3469 RepID=A0A4Y7JRF5_PAPSO|nr:hypothetical protein C5167_024355 [Papaver somniferum]